VTCRGNRRQPIFHDDADRLCWIGLRNDVLRRFGWRLREYCLMTNHFHLLFETTAPNLALGMHRLNHQYALYFNERHGFEGHLFEKRYWSRLIEAEEHLAATIAYIAFNPVKSGLCAVPWEWRWSSFFEVDKSFAFD